MAREFEGPLQRQGRQLKEETTSLLRYKAREKAKQKYAGDEVDNRAFDTMERATKSKASNLFTESEYNAFATDKEREGYDRKAFNILKGMYDADSAKNKFKDIDFNKYLDLLKPSLFEERVLSREGDQKAGDFFLDIYEGDFDQFKASALNSIRGKSPSGKY